jgi:hypothetical protein
LSQFGAKPGVSDAQLGKLLGFGVSITNAFRGGRLQPLHTTLFSLMSTATPTDAQLHTVWPQFASDQLSFYQSIHVADPSLGVWESFGLAFSSQAKFGATFNGMSDADFAKAAYHDAFGVDPTAAQAQFVTDQVHSHATMYANAHAYGADNPAVATTLGQGATFGILVGVAEEMGIHTHTIA